jgi:hypothetical protein
MLYTSSDPLSSSTLAWTGEAVAAPLAGRRATLLLLALAGTAWSGTFGLFVVGYLGPLIRPRHAAPKHRRGTAPARPRRG